MVAAFSVGPEFQFASNMVGAVEYVGNRTRNGRRLRNLNEGIISGATVTFPYAQYGYGNAYLEQIVTNGRADYNALQMRMQRRMSGGLAYTVAYTWSKAEGDFLDHLSAGGGATGNSPGSTYAMEKDYGLLAFDIPQRLVTSFIYELPIGEGRHFNPGGVAGARNHCGGRVGRQRGHLLRDGGELGVALAGEEAAGHRELGEAVPQGGQRSGAEATQGGGKARGRRAHLLTCARCRGSVH